MGIRFVDVPAVSYFMSMQPRQLRLQNLSATVTAESVCSCEICLQLWLQNQSVTAECVCSFNCVICLQRHTAAAEFDYSSADSSCSCNSVCRIWQQRPNLTAATVGSDCRSCRFWLQLLSWHAGAKVWGDRCAAASSCGLFFFCQTFIVVVAAGIDQWECRVKNATMTLQFMFLWMSVLCLISLWL